MRNICLTFAMFTLASALACSRPDRSPNSPASTASATPSHATNGAPADIGWKIVEEFTYTWKPTQSPVHFVLELAEGPHDAGDFTRIRIQASGQQEFVLDNSDGWIKYNAKEQLSSVYKRLHKRNLVLSKYALILPGSPRADEPPLIFLRSWGYASEAERLHVIGFQPSGRPILLFNDELELVDFRDLDGDGYPEIVGRPCLGEEFGNGLVTYTPFHVYKIPRDASRPAVLSVAASKSYNLEYYFGWAGPNCSEKMAVVLHPPSGGKPIIIPVDKAQKMMGETKERKK